MPELPNMEHVVQTVRDSRAWDFRTKAGLCAYGNAVVVALHKADPDFVHLAKSESQNHCVDPLGRNVAVDASLYKPTGQAFDFIGSAGFGDPPPENKVWWGTSDPIGKYGPDMAVEPVEGDDGEQPPGPTPTPTPGPMPADDLDRALLHTTAALLEQLEARVEAHRQRMEAINKRFDDDFRHFDARLDQVEARPPVPTTPAPPIVVKKPNWWPF